MDSNFGWTEEGLQLLSAIKKLVDDHGGNEECAHKIEVEWLISPSVKRSKNTFPNGSYTYKGWKDRELRKAIDMRKSGESYANIGRALGRSRLSVSGKFAYLREIGQLTEMGEWVK